MTTKCESPSGRLQRQGGFLTLLQPQTLPLSPPPPFSLLSPLTIHAPRPSPPLQPPTAPYLVSLGAEMLASEDSLGPRQMPWRRLCPPGLLRQLSFDDHPSSGHETAAVILRPCDRVGGVTTKVQRQWSSDRVTVAVLPRPSSISRPLEAMLQRLSSDRSVTTIF